MSESITVVIVKRSKKIIIPMFLSLSIMMGWVLVNGETVIPAVIWNQNWIPTYLIFFCIMSIAFGFYVMAEQKWESVRELFSFSTFWAIPGIIIGASLTGFGLFVIYEFVLGLRAVWNTWLEIVGLILYFGIIVSPIERIVFTYYLMEIGGKWTASLWFGLFHFTMSGFNVNFLLVMIAFNLLLIYILELRSGKKDWKYRIIGLPMLISIHATVDVFAFLYLGLLG